MEGGNGPTREATWGGSAARRTGVTAAETEIKIRRVVREPTGLERLGAAVRARPILTVAVAFALGVLLALRSGD
jgi:hypothetical protein